MSEKDSSLTDFSSDRQFIRKKPYIDMAEEDKRPWTERAHIISAWKEWVQVIFAIVIAVEMVVVFDSYFLAFLTLAFFFYIPKVNLPIFGSYSQVFATW